MGYPGIKSEIWYLWAETQRWAFSQKLVPFNLQVQYKVEITVHPYANAHSCFSFGMVLDMKDEDGQKVVRI